MKPPEKLQVMDVLVDRGNGKFTIECNREITEDEFITVNKVINLISEYEYNRQYLDIFIRGVEPRNDSKTQN